MKSTLNLSRFLRSGQPWATMPLTIIRGKHDTVLLPNNTFVSTATFLFKYIAYCHHWFLFTLIPYSTFFRLLCASKLMCLMRTFLSTCFYEYLLLFCIYFLINSPHLKLSIYKNGFTANISFTPSLLKISWYLRQRGEEYKLYNVSKSVFLHTGIRQRLIAVLYP